MPELQPAVIFTGVDSGPDQERIDAGLVALGVDLSPLADPEVGVVHRLRDIALTGGAPRDTMWGLGVEKLFATIEGIKSGIGSRTLDRGYQLRDVAPVIDNPFFKEPTTSEGGSRSFSGRPRHLKLSQERLSRWDGTVIEPSVYSQRVDEKSVTLESLAVLIQLRPAEIRSQTRHSNW